MGILKRLGKAFEDLENSFSGLFNPSAVASTPTTPQPSPAPTAQPKTWDQGNHGVWGQPALVAFPGCWPPEHVCVALAATSYPNIWVNCAPNIMRSMAPQYLNQTRDCANLVNTSKNPRVFFERLLSLHQLLKALANMEKTIRFSGELPSQALRRIEQNRGLTINNFLDRYYQETAYQISLRKTQKAKENNVRLFWDSLCRYQPLMTSENIARMNELYHVLENSVK